MLGVVVPAHNEERLLPACLKSIARAVSHRALAGEKVAVVVVADACTDATVDIARRSGVEVVEIHARRVGVARDAGVQRLLARGARWIACTDADSEVPGDWLAVQASAGADAFCGLVRVSTWHGLHARVIDRMLAGYQRRHGHRHIHGANLGFCAEIYRVAGGFEPVACHEDVGLIERIERSGGRVVWSADAAVTTSARLDFRAPEGFGARLARCLEEHPAWVSDSRAIPALTVPAV